MRHKQKPTVTPVSEGTALEAERYTHPAFGNIAVTRCSSNPAQPMFGSDMCHTYYMNVRISTAHLDRHLNGDWIHADKTLMEFRISETQWAQMIASIGNGGGTPITLEYLAPQSGGDLPNIDPIHNMRSLFQQEFKQEIQGYMADAATLMLEMQTLVQAGKAGKTQLRELQAKVARFAEALPGNMKFIAEQFDETMERTVAAAKADINQHAQRTAQQYGLSADSMRNLTLEDNATPARPAAKRITRNR